MGVNMKSLEKQRGMTMVSWIVVAALAGFVLITGVKLFPTYYQYYQLKTIMTSMSEDGIAKAKSKADIDKAFKKFLRTNEIRNLEKDEYKIARVKGSQSYAVVVDYVRLTPLFSNLSLHSHFYNATEVRQANAN